MRAIIIAAGRGSRLRHLTGARPKTMVEIGGRPILHHQLAAYAAHGVTEVHVIRGYLGHAMRAPGCVFHDNPEWERNNILLSLFYAEEALQGPLLISYGDILFTEATVAAVLEAPGDLCLAVDRAWAKTYEGRSDHPVAQAELAEVEGSRVLRVGKRVGPERALGEFIGLMRCSAAGTRQLCAAYRSVAARYAADPDAPFQSSPRFRHAYLTDLIEAMIARGLPVHHAPIDGGWQEIDTVQDYTRACARWSHPELSP